MLRSTSIPESLSLLEEHVTQTRMSSRSISSTRYFLARISDFCIAEHRVLKKISKLCDYFIGWMSYKVLRLPVIRLKMTLNNKIGLWISTDRDIRKNINILMVSQTVDNVNVLELFLGLFDNLTTKNLEIFNNIRD